MMTNFLFEKQKKKQRKMNFLFSKLQEKILAIQQMRNKKKI
jgi:hypothetical protein